MFLFPKDKQITKPLIIHVTKEGANSTRAQFYYARVASTFDSTKVYVHFICKSGSSAR